MDALSRSDGTLKQLGLLLARLVLAWVFIRAALPKIEDPLAFAGSIEAFRLMEGPLALWVAIVLPWLELVVAVGLLTPWLRQACALTISGLLLLFISLHLSAWARGLDVNCGCFGLKESSPDYHWLILRNLGLLVLAVMLLWQWARAPRQATPSADAPAHDGPGA